jgi:cytochrome c oxidase cbb3-type subunit 2
MKNIKLIFAGVLFTLSASFIGILLSGRVQLGSLGRAPAEEGGPLFPLREPGLVIQGRQVYISLGCVACHTQQVRPASQGSDIAKGYGPRHSVARDYVLQSSVLLGSHRIGPDLANYGARVSSENEIHAHLRSPKAGSAMPSYDFLYTTGKEGAKVPTEKATALVAYLKSLKIDYSSPEAKLNQ